MKRALVTGGAGLIGSHVGDLRDRETVSAALDNIDIVFHEAAYGGFMPEITKYVHVNSLGTAQMLEVIREKNLPTKKIIVASSQAVYSEGAGICPKHRLVFPKVRPIEQLRRGDWSVHCPICNAVTESAETDKLDGLPVNVGSSRGTPIREIAEQLSAALQIDLQPEVNGEFRPGEMRHITSDITRIRGVGYEPNIDLTTGIERYLDWIRLQSDVRDYFSEAETILRSKGIVHRAVN